MQVCLEARTAPRHDILIVLRQMQALLESLPLGVLLQNSDNLTLHTLLQIALEAQAEKPRLRCGALGFLYLERVRDQASDERTAEVQGELLTFFLLQPRRPWTDEQIFEALWPGKQAQRAQWSFHTARKRLHTFAGEEVILMLKRGQYSLNPRVPVWFDVAEFESLLTRAQTIRTRSAQIKLLESAVQLYRGDFMEKNYKDWVAPVRTRLREKYIAALLQLGELNRPETPEQALAWYEQALHADDLNEDAYLRLVELHTQLGNRISAHRMYVACIDAYWRELQRPPSPEFTRRGQQLLDSLGRSEQ